MRKLNHITGKLQQSWMDLRCKLIANYDLNRFRRIYHIHIRKTGGTSLNHMFLGLAQNSARDGDLYKKLAESNDHRIIQDGKVYVGWNTRLISQGNYFYAFSHVPLHVLVLPPETFTITVLRDPVNRVLSHYKMLIEYRDSKVDHPAMKIEGTWLGESLDDFLDRIPVEDLLRQVYMFSPTLSVDEAYQKIINCSHFMFTEDFDDGVRSLNSKLGTHLKPIHIRRTKATPAVSEEQISKLRKMLEKEYELVERLMNHSTNSVNAYENSSSLIKSQKSL